MKKLLAMVLALVMTLSLAVSANAFKDDKSISDDYAEAVAVLNGMGVFKGYEDNSFKPEGNITRAEVATIIYRIYTADVAKNDKSGLYATYNKFSDMAGASWAAGYIGYCANASLVKGYPDGTFKPSGNVTGYEVLAMILRAVGYDKNNEFSGADWALHVAQTAQQLGVLDNVAKTTDLNAPASRELVAELLFQGIQKAQVTYTPAFGYVTDKVISTKTNSLGEKNFKLAKKAASDEWGRPATTWTYNVGDKETTFVAKPNTTYTTAVTECDVAHDAGLKADKTYSLVVNGQAAENYVITRLDTVTKIGAQGRLTEVYDDVIVMIDTFLAKVISVSDATYDAQGHLKKAAEINLAVVLSDATSVPTTANYTLTNGETNYPYAKGDYVLVNAKTTNATFKASATQLAGGTAKYGEIVGVASSFDGAQTVIHYNDGKHTVEGTDYNDALEFHLNQAGVELVKHTWLLDQYNNLIGVVDIETAYTYGVIKSMWWVGDTSNGAGDAIASVVYMDGSEANVTIGSLAIDGNKANTPRHSTYTNLDMTVTATSALTGTLYVDTNAYTNETSVGNDSTGIIGGHMFRFNTLSNGKVAAVEVTDELADTAITKNVSKLGSNNVYTNASTKYLVQVLDTVNNTVSYKVVEGYSNIDSYTHATVDYVDLNNDGWVDYAYVTGNPDNAVTSNLFYLTTTAYTYNKNETSDVIVDYILTGYVDGQPGTITIADTNTALVNRIITGGANKAWVVVKTNGYVTDIINDVNTSSAFDLDTMNPVNKAYADMNAIAISGGAGDEVVGTVYYDKSSGERYNIANVMQPTLGAWAEDMSSKNVVLVYKNNKEVVQAYIVDAADQPITDYEYTPTLTVATASTNGVAPIDIDGTKSIKVAYGADTVTLTLNYPVGNGISSVAMKVNGVAQTAGSNSTGAYNYTYTINSADLARGYIVVDLTTSTATLATAGSASYQIAVTGTLIQH